MTTSPVRDGVRGLEGLSDAARELVARRATLGGGTAATAAIAPRADATAPAPLSSWQESIWFVDQMEQGDGVYNCPAWLRISGALDVELLRRSLSEIFRRHEVLRSRVCIDAGRTAQCPVQDFAFSLATIDLSNAAAAEYSAVVEREARAPFDLATGPFARATLVRLGPEEHVLLFTVHHIAFDGWSSNVFFGELGELYSAFTAERAPQLTEPRLQYADFAAWQRSELDNGSAVADLAYWTAQLDGAPPLLQLPADRTRPAIRTHQAGRATRTLPLALAEQLRVLGLEEGATLFMTTLAAFQLFVSRMSGAHDVVIGTPAAGRTRAETESMLGCFINVLPMRSRVSYDESFRELLMAVRRTALDAFAHQNLPFDVLVDRLQPERSATHTPVTQVLFNFRNTPAAPVHLGGLEARAETGAPINIMSDFDLEIEQGEGGLVCTALFRSDMFDERTVDRWLGHFQTLLEAIVDAPDERIGRLPLLTGRERREILVDWNGRMTAPDYETCVHELIEAQVQRTPDRVAVVGVGGGESLTYAELDGRANILARDLVNRGVAPGAVVGVCMERCPDAIIAVLAVLKAGGAYLPLDATFPEERIAFMLEDARTELVLTQRNLVENAIGSVAQRIYVDEQYWGAHADIDGGVGSSARRRAATPDDVAYVMYTSGSTGRPKGAMNTHRAVCNFVLRQIAMYAMGDAIVMHRTPMIFDPSVREIFGSLASGARIVLAASDRQGDAGYLASLVDEHGVTFLCTVPSLLKALLEVPDVSRLCRTLRAVTCGGEVMPLSMHDRFLQTFTASLNNHYGPSETAVCVSHWRCAARAGRQTIPIGRPMDNMRVYVLDAEGEPAPVGIPGEICIGGVCVGSGYLGREALTADRFVPDPFAEFDRDAADRPVMYRTGDTGRWDGDGSLKFLGRADRQLKVRGVRVELGEIELALAAAPGVRNCVVTASRDAGGDVAIIAYVVRREANPPSERELREHLKRNLLSQMIPSTFLMLEAIPLGTNGKADLLALPAVTPGRDAGAGEVVLPRTDAERLVASIWTEVLKRTAVSVVDDFFELGGHSLHATQVVARIRERTGAAISLRKFFGEPTVEALAREIEDAALLAHDHDELARILQEVEEQGRTTEETH